MKWHASRAWSLQQHSEQNEARTCISVLIGLWCLGDIALPFLGEGLRFVPPKASLTAPFRDDGIWTRYDNWGEIYMGKSQAGWEIGSADGQQQLWMLSWSRLGTKVWMARLTVFCLSQPLKKEPMCQWSIMARMSRSCTNSWCMWKLANKLQGPKWIVRYETLYQTTLWIEGSSWQRLHCRPL